MKLFLLANTAITETLGLSNDFQLLQDDWIQISPYGDFPHPVGLQRVDNSAAQKMVANFDGAIARLKRAFGGLPFYVGHPDVPGIANQYPDKRAFGWINKLEARTDGLYGQVKWSPDGKKLVTDAHYKFFSPFWEATQIGTANGKPLLQPTTLRSVGLTNNPNIPVSPLANEQPQPDPMKELLIKLLSLANTATEEEIEASIKTVLAENTKAKADLASELPKVATLTTELANAKTALTTANTERDSIKTSLANERKARVDLLLANAMTDGRVTPATKADWETKLTTAFDTEVTALANAKPIHTSSQSRTKDIGQRREEIKKTVDLSNQVIGKVHAYMAEAKCDYDTAWGHVMSTNPSLANALNTPA